MAVTTFFVDPDSSVLTSDGSVARPWSQLDWAAVDAALARGNVTVFFSARAAGADTNQLSGDLLSLSRTDDGPSRLVLDGISQFNADDASPRWEPNTGASRATFRGASTTEAKVKRSHLTLRGFELANARAQGVYYEAGDDVVLEDLVIHDNGSSPAIFFDYANRSGLRSTGITIRNCHLYSITGECIYIGGVENTGGAAHDGVLIENNLIRECGARQRNGDDWDGINIKDQLSNVVVRRNVIKDAYRGMQITSSDLIIEHNLIIDTQNASIVLGGGWSRGISAATRVAHNVLVRGTTAGVYLDADTDAATGPLITHNTIIGAIGTPGAGLHFAGNAGLTATAQANVVTDCATGVDGWGQAAVEFDACVFWRNTSDTRRAMSGGSAERCTSVDPRYVDAQQLAGDDHVFFTADDGWLPTAPQVLHGELDGGSLGASLE